MAAAAAAARPRVWTTPEWAALKAHAEAVKSTHLRDLLRDPARCAALTFEADGVVLDASRQRATAETLPLLLSLAHAAGVREQIAAMLAGAHINVTEDRAVLHTALRAPAGSPPLVVDGQDVTADVAAVRAKVGAFAGRVRAGTHVGATGKRLTDVVSIGIGGSYLGVEYVYEALRKDAAAASGAAGRRLRFLANVDPVDVSRALEGLDPEATLVIVVSKTFTTAETMLNARTVRDWLIKGVPGAAPADVVAKHMAAVSTAVPREWRLRRQTGEEQPPPPPPPPPPPHPIPPPRS
jgi:glucose-6-phosphate isomerase